MLAHREILTPSTKGLHSKRPLTPPNTYHKAALPFAHPPPFSIIQYRVSGLSAASISSSRNSSPRIVQGPLCQDVMGLMLHQHLHAFHICAPELQAIFHSFDLEDKPTVTRLLQSLQTAKYWRSPTSQNICYEGELEKFSTFCLYHPDLLSSQQKTTSCSLFLVSHISV